MTICEPLSQRQDLISECEGLGLDLKAPRHWRESYSDEQLRAAITWLDEKGTIADQLIAAAATSERLELWISRQILAHERPSQILATMARAPGDLFAAISRDGAPALTFACLIMFALPFFALGFVLPA
ncbi:hypothetical protein [Mesorhizobium sp. M2A.F.Ca.ET.067.02.1.1]|uniref:hypothetical protein n=1 Tax=Mesorhizobium sp. M2A.F.Ca.ET.067.02.1.1 TaxID=2496749 RepID=UPI000FD4B738|nr:hypothetical protein [Mesorhizobium sp. M2A.F.Ca.ET.067.02.1.1]RUW69832.1 hypothetical protein EOA28_24790 [Mesorhizobium sp. M2A.F.Ca.ET.067.02.1.1]